VVNSAITFDIDWAPDWAIALCRDLCREAGVPATFFATHPSDILIELQADPLFEIGIHPNFLPGSSHGCSTEDVMAHVLALAPAARSMRTHALHQSTRIFAGILREFPQIAVDVSLFLPDHPGLDGTILHLGADRPLMRLPYWWEDDVAALTPGWEWTSRPRASTGLRIFDFHPVHVALNMADLGAYERLKARTDARLEALSQGDFAPFVNRGPGTRTYLEALLREASSVPFGRIGDLAGLNPRDVTRCA
jgi:hypothetical protein